MDQNSLRRLLILKTNYTIPCCFPRENSETRDYGETYPKKFFKSGYFYACY